MAEKKYYWLKLQEDYFRTKEVKKLRKIAGGDTFVIIYLKMQLLSLKNNGMLIYEGVEDNLAEELALELDENEDNIKMTLAFLQNNGMIEQTSGYEYFLNRVPEMTASETDAAKRMRISRQKRNNVTELCNNVQDGYNELQYIEIEKEIDIERETKDLPLKKESKIFTNVDNEYKLARYLSNQIAERYNRPLKDEKTLQKWASEFDKMVRIDKCNIDEMLDVLVFTQEKDEFWQSNILSAGKFRKQYITLLAQSKRKVKEK